MKTLTLIVIKNKASGRHFIMDVETGKYTLLHNSMLRSMRNMGVGVPTEVADLKELKQFTRGFGASQ